MDLAVSVEIETLARERDQLKQDKEQLERQVHGLNDSLKALDKEKEDLESQVETLEDRVTELELEISSGKNEVEELLDGLGVSAVDWKLTENALDRVAALAKLKGGRLPTHTPLEQKTCSNCGHAFSPSNLDGLVVVLGSPGVAAAICPDCSRDTRVVKIVLRRGADGQFAYEQYSALETVKKAFGCAG